jgi:RNA polymerase sigma-32 factor
VNATPTAAAIFEYFISNLYGKIKHRIVNSCARAINEQDYEKMADNLGVSVREVVEMDQRISGPDISLNRSANYGDDEGAEAIGASLYANSGLLRIDLRLRFLTI